jgi:predicted NBD/HSP70 family sugar kinase
MSHPGTTPDTRIGGARPASHAARLRPSSRLLPSQARVHNRSVVLGTLFHNGPASRADLARATGLTPVTISDLVSSLMVEGLVEELGQQAGTRVGKPATLVGMRSHAHLVVAVDLSDVGEVRGTLVDLSGAVVAHRTVSEGTPTGDAAVERVADLCTELLAAADRPVLGVGIGSPGIVDAHGVVAEAPNLGWVDVPLAHTLTERLDVPVWVGNDANCAAIGEFTYGGAAEGGVMVITIGEGVGAGLLLDGVLVRGTGLSAGEIGHVTVDDDGAPCTCGRAGCLETLLSVSRLRARLAPLDDAARADVVADAGRRLGGVLAPIVSALDVRDVRISAPSDPFDDAFLAATLHTVLQRTLPSSAAGLELRTAHLGEGAVLQGAAVLVLVGALGIS